MKIPGKFLSMSCWNDSGLVAVYGYGCVKYQRPNIDIDGLGGFKYDDYWGYSADRDNCSVCGVEDHEILEKAGM
jgi:hypothetical protein